MEELKACVEIIEKTPVMEAIPFVLVQVLLIVFAFMKKSLPQFVKELPEYVAKVISGFKK